MASISERFQSYLKKTHLISPGESVWVACSGGSDSVALFHLLMGLRKAWKLRLGLLHFNHGLRGAASDSDQKFVRRLAEKSKVHFLTDKPKTSLKRLKKSIEESAREARYEFFVKAAAKKKIDKIALAHHANDQAETVLMRILQGTGSRGLLGIRQNIKIRQASFVRPLLLFTKAEIKSYLKQNGIKFRTDRSNDSPKFLRNKIRRELLPWLEKRIDPNVVGALARLPSIFSEEEEWFNELEASCWGKAFKIRKKQTVHLYRKRFSRCPKPIQFRILDKALKLLDSASGMNFEAWERIRPQMDKPKTRVSLPRDLEMELTPSVIKLQPSLSRRGLHS